MLPACWSRLSVSSDGSGALEHGMEQHVAPCREITGCGMFGLVVTDAPLAGNKDHGRWRHPADIDGVMAGARHHVHVIAARQRGSAAYRIDTPRIELDGW